MDTLAYILGKYSLKKNQSRYKLYRSRDGSLSTVFKELGFKLGAQIGVDTGRYSKNLHAIIPNLKLYAIDAWKEPYDGIYIKAKNRLKPFNSQIIREDPMDAVKRFTSESLDFVYINTFSDYKNAIDDIKEWSKKVRKGGIVAGHGYTNNRSNGQFFAVRNAVDKWVKKNGIRSLFVFAKNDPSTWFYVKGKNA